MQDALFFLLCFCLVITWSDMVLFAVNVHIITVHSSTMKVLCDSVHQCSQERLIGMHAPPVGVVLTAPEAAVR